MKQWYESLFEDYAKTYESESFVQGTKGECDFLEKEMGGNRQLRILDVGCGTGRHSIELARRGYRLTGVDLSESQLALARKKAVQAKVDVMFEKQDARTLPYENEFDVALMLCEGSFPLMETDEMNFEILKGVYRSLKAPGKFVFTTLNGLFPIFNNIEKFCASNTADGNATYRKNKFDLMTFRDHNITEITDDNGNKKSLACNERYYIPSEINWLLKSLGFKNIGIYGAKLGAFSRNDTLTPDDFEMLVVAEK